MAERKIGHFRILRHLGQGAAANSFLVYNEQENRESVLKILKPALANMPGVADRFLQAAESSSGITHPSAAIVLSAGRLGPSVFAETRFAEGSALSEMISSRGPLDPSFCVNIIKQSAAILNFLHNNNGIIHGGLRPGDILISSSGGRDSVTLTDFGLSASAILPREDIGIPGSAGYDFVYSAPEQISEGLPSHGSDIYSLGIILFESLAGTVPFSAGTPSGTAEMHLGKAMPSISDFRKRLPPDLVKIVDRCLKKNPDDRFLTAIELAGALNRLESTLPPPELSSQPPAQEEEPFEGSPFLHVEQEYVFLINKSPVALKISNPGDAPLSGRISSSCSWAIVSQSGFDIDPDGEIEITVRACRLPASSRNKAVLSIDSNGGEDSITIEIDPAACGNKSDSLAAPAAAIASLLSGIYILWGFASSAGAGPAMIFAAAVLVLFAVASVIRKYPPLSAGGPVAILFLAWVMLDTSINGKTFFLASAACALPSTIMAAASSRLFRLFPSTAFAVLLPVLLCGASFAGAKIISAGSSGSVSFAQPPLFGFERKSTLTIMRDTSLGTKNRPPAGSPATNPRNPSATVAIKSPTANIRAGAGTKYKILIAARQGDSFEKLGENNGWVRVRLPDGTPGWVAKSLCSEINSETNKK